MGGLEEHNCDLPSFSSNVAPGYRPRIPYRKINKTWGEGGRGARIQKTNRNLRLNEGTKGMLRKRDFAIHSIRCHSNVMLKLS